jgi:hypothetical protein
MTEDKRKMFDRITRIGNRAVRKAQEENRRLGIPNVYCINGKMIFEMPDGTIRTDYKFQL